MKTLMAIIALLAAMIYATFGFAAHAGIQCRPHNEVPELFLKKYNESPVFSGVLGNDNSLHVYVSPAGTWTLIGIDAAGLACILASGRGGAVQTLPAQGVKG